MFKEFIDIIYEMKNSFNFKTAILLLSGSIFSQEIDLNNINFANLDENELKKYIELTQKNNSQLNDQVSDVETLIEINEKDQDSDAKEKEYKIDERLRIFGHDYINTIPTTISATTDLPVPGEYKVSLGDKLRIIFSGSKDEIFTTTVQLDGTIIFPELGKILVLGKNFNETQKTIEELVNSSYVGVNVNISIAELNAKKISIIGAVKSPGVYLVNPFTTVSNALAYAGGVEDYASLRAITVISPDGRTATFDLYDLLIKGDRSKDFTISAGDTVKVEGTNSLVKIHGSVLRPSIYEFTQLDTYQDLIDFTLGLDENGDSDNITSTFIASNTIKSEKVNLDSLVKLELKEILVGRNVKTSSKGILVKGSEVTEGYYELSSDSFSNFIDNLEFSDEIYPFYATYEQTLNSGLENRFTTFSLADKDTYLDFKLTKNSKITFFSREDFLANENSSQNDNGKGDSERINNGAILDMIKPDIIQLYIGTKYFNPPLAGKVTPKEIHEYFGSNENFLIDNVNIVTSKGLITNAYEKSIDSKNIFTITIPREKDDLILVSIEGAVNAPGLYTLPSTSNLIDLYSVAGGFSENAYPDGIIFKREEIKKQQIDALNQAKIFLTSQLIQNSTKDTHLDIKQFLETTEIVEPEGRVAGNFSMDSNFNELKEFILEDADSIIVPSTPQQVLIIGEVLSSKAVLYEEGLDLYDYVSMAGGFTDYAKKRSVYVIRANGSAETIGGSVFSKQLKIYPGDSIIVPRDLGKLDTLPLVSIATKIISDLAFSAASLNAIQN